MSSLVASCSPSRPIACATASACPRSMPVASRSRAVASGSNLRLLMACPLRSFECPWSVARQSPIVGQVQKTKATTALFVLPDPDFDRADYGRRSPSAWGEGPPSCRRPSPKMSDFGEWSIARTTPRAPTAVRRQRGCNRGRRYGSGHPLSVNAFARHHSPQMQWIPALPARAAFPLHRNHSNPPILLSSRAATMAMIERRWTNAISPRR